MPETILPSQPPIAGSSSALPQTDVPETSAPIQQKWGLIRENGILVHHGITLPWSSDPVEDARDERFEFLCQGLPR